MTFSSIPFLFYFLPLFIAVYFASPWKNLALLVGSLVFYAWGEPVFILLLIASLAFNHVIGKAIAATRNIRVLALGIVGNLLVLGWFKYAGFIAGGLSALCGFIGAESVVEINPHLPLGISFFTFQAISLLVDLYRRDAEPPRSAIDTALYISMFPQLIAGPIVRYKTISGQLRKRDHTFEKFSDGARLLILGLAQKVLLANTLATAADVAFDASAAGTLSLVGAWLGLGAYSLQIYFDFAGYSNMAIGMGRMFGFELPRNFNFPYVAQSVTEFWRRWHITLSQWFRDYLYIPLGGNQLSPVRTYFNLWIVFLLCGLWHGAAWAFIVWGAYHGAFLVIERAFLSKYLKAAPQFLRHLYLPLVVALGWVPFRAVDLSQTVDYYGALFGISAAAPSDAVNVMPGSLDLIFAVAALIALWPLVTGLLARLPQQFFEPIRAHSIAPVRFVSLQLALGALLFCCAAALAGGAYNPFIYFRF